MSEVEIFIPARERDLGGFTIQRILPYATHRMVGPFIFFDHIGPHKFARGEGMDVRPHPHINLATVTYLFEGSILHRDSLGCEQLIEPGAVNWMTAGFGIVHSERTPAEARTTGSLLHGLQCWVALPSESEEMEPSFAHHPAHTLPEFTHDQAQIKLLLGTFFDWQSPVKTESDILYADIHLPAEGRLNLPGSERELAIYPVSGALNLRGESLAAGGMAVMKSGLDLCIEAQDASRFMILGGRPLEGERHIWWNFVSSSKERIAKAKSDWREKRFPLVPGDAEEFIPLPDDPAPKGTPL